ncbi:hypothetical protein BJY52DRAFT_1226560 [Lactarius psammicola]|nr:hypothetical protein BJY52DRAFT_1226560 [Lactarius psammicola]
MQVAPEARFARNELSGQGGIQEGKNNFRILHERIPTLSTLIEVQLTRRYQNQPLGHLRGQPVGVFDPLRESVTTSLMEALAVPVHMESGEVMGDIEDMPLL